jgi:hypothetical protein
LNFSQDNQVANELDLVGGEVNRTRNVGRKPKLPGDYTTVSELCSSPYRVSFPRYLSVSSDRASVSVITNINIHSFGQDSYVHCVF